VYSIGTKTNTIICMIIHALSGLHFDKYPMRMRKRIGAGIVRAFMSVLDVLNTVFILDYLYLYHVDISCLGHQYHENALCTSLQMTNYCFAQSTCPLEPNLSIHPNVCANAGSGFIKSPRITLY